MSTQSGGPGHSTRREPGPVDTEFNLPDVALGPELDAGPRPLWQRLLIGRRPGRTLIRMAVLAGLVFLVCRFVLLPMRVQGESMVPTYRSGGFNFINTLSYLGHKPRRGDVVGIEMAGRKVMLMKRIVGLPSETIAIHQGVVLIDGQPLPEPYVKEKRPWEVEEQRLGDDEYLVIGDNRSMPQEAHRFGIVRERHIVGKVLF